MICWYTLLLAEATAIFSAMSGLIPALLLIAIMAVLFWLTRPAMTPTAEEGEDILHEDDDGPS